MIDKLIEKTEKHISYCQAQIMRPEMYEDRNTTACSHWIEERMAYEHILLDLYKIKDGKEPDTDYKDPSTIELNEYYDRNSED